MGPGQQRDKRSRGPPRHDGHGPKASPAQASSTPSAPSAPTFSRAPQQQSIGGHKKDGRPSAPSARAGPPRQQMMMTGAGVKKVEAAPSAPSAPPAAAAAVSSDILDDGPDVLPISVAAAVDLSTKSLLSGTYHGSLGEALEQEPRRVSVVSGSAAIGDGLDERMEFLTSEAVEALAGGEEEGEGETIVEAVGAGFGRRNLLVNVGVGDAADDVGGFSFPRSFLAYRLLRGRMASTTPDDVDKLLQSWVWTDQISLKNSEFLSNIDSAELSKLLLFADVLSASKEGELHAVLEEDLLLDFYGLFRALEMPRLAYLICLELFDDNGSKKAKQKSSSAGTRVFKHFEGVVEKQLSRCRELFGESKSAFEEVLLRRLEAEIKAGTHPIPAKGSSLETILASEGRQKGKAMASFPEFEGIGETPTTFADEVWEWRSLLRLHGKSFHNVQIVTNDGGRFFAHFEVLASRSNFWWKLISFGGPEVSEWRKSGEIRVQMSAIVFRVLFDFLYLGVVPAFDDKKAWEGVMMHSQMYSDRTLSIGILDRSYVGMIAGWIHPSVAQQLFSTDLGDVAGRNLPSGFARFLDGLMRADYDKEESFASVVSSAMVFFERLVKEKDLFERCHVYNFFSRRSDGVASSREKLVCDKLHDVLNREPSYISEGRPGRFNNWVTPRLCSLVEETRVSDEWKSFGCLTAQFYQRGSIAPFLPLCRIRLPDLPPGMLADAMRAKGKIEEGFRGSSRVFRWTLPRTGKDCVVAVNGYKSPFILNTDAVTAMILLRFNEGGSLTAKTVSRKSGIAEDQMSDVLDRFRLLASSRGNRGRLISPAASSGDGDDDDDDRMITEDTPCVAREDFWASTKSINLAMPGEALPTAAMKEDVDFARNASIRRATIRVMRARGRSAKPISHSQLAKEVAAEVAKLYGRMEGFAKVFKKVIGILTDQEYLVRDEDQRGSYRYYD